MVRLNVKKLVENKNTIILSSKDALLDVTPIKWSQEVVNGNKKVVVKSMRNMEEVD